MNNQYTLGPSPFMEGWLVKYIGMISFYKLLWIGVIAAVTYFILDVFMKKHLNVMVEDKHLDEKESKLIATCVIMLLITFVPITGIVVALFNAYSSLRVLHYVWAAVISIVGAWLTTLVLKTQLDKDDPRRTHPFLVLQSFGIILEIMGKYIAIWIQRVVIGCINLIIRVIHLPFVTQYAVFATIINLIISGILVNFMGISQEAGAANLIGSGVGGILHMIINKQKLKDLRANIEKENQKDKK